MIPKKDPAAVTKDLQEKHQNRYSEFLDKTSGGGVTPADSPVAGSHRAPKALRPRSRSDDEARFTPFGG
eukprot:2566358-Pyramimonas_sp.AAC.1